MTTTKAKTPAAKAKENTKDSASTDEVQVKLKMPLWDSLKQRSFTINDLYPCSEKEAQRLIENGTAVKADA